MSEPRTLVFGLGVTGFSCAKFLRGRGPVSVCDTRAQPPLADRARAEFDDIELMEPQAVDLTDFDRIVVSPGISLDHCLVVSARARGVDVVSDIDLFLAHAGAPVIGITGTNGKSTVTTLVGELLSAVFDVVPVGGNLGVAALDLLTDAADRYVLELSSFQLERLGEGTFDVGSVLNISPDHLDRYPSFDAYAEAKRRVYRGCRAAVYDGADENTWPRRVHSDATLFMRTLDDDLGDAGLFARFQNMLAHLQVFMKKTRIFATRREPARIPGTVDAEPQPDRVDFLSH